MRSANSSDTLQAYLRSSKPPATCTQIYRHWKVTSPGTDKGPHVHALLCAAPAIVWCMDRLVTAAVAAGTWDRKRSDWSEEICISTSADCRSARSPAEEGVPPPCAASSSQKMPSSRSSGKAWGPFSFASAAASAYRRSINCCASTHQFAWV